MNNPAPFSEVLKNEHAQVLARRRHLQLFSANGPGDEISALGVCLSGGGIRSATFNLGILQGLAERGLLPFIDYVSTVSGGGYIGTWLHGVIRRKFKGEPQAAAEEISPSAAGASGPESPRIPKVPGDATNDPVTFLRKYSNYLAPRLGLFGPDFWVIAVIWIRNMVLNQLILIPFLAASVLVAVHIGFAEQGVHPASDSQTGTLGILTAVASLFGAILIASANLRAIVSREKHPHEAPAGELERPPVILCCVALILLAAFLMSWATTIRSVNPIGVAVVFFLLFLALQIGGGFLTCFLNQHPEHPEWWLPHFIWMPATCAAASTGLLIGAFSLISRWASSDHSAWLTVTWGPPLLILVIFSGVSLHIGLMGADFPDSAREWLARLGAMLSIACAGWIALFAIGVFGPWWLASFALHYGKSTATLAAGWIATVATGVLGGRSSATKGATG